MEVPCTSVRYAYVAVTSEPCGSTLLVGVDAAATGAVLRLVLGGVARRALAVGLAGLLDGQVHGGAGSRLKTLGEQVAGAPMCDKHASPRTYPHLLTI
jgi:hypothetical protein